MTQLTKKYLNDLSYQIIGAAIEVHKELGPGLLEQVYETCLEHELRQRGFKVERQQSVPIQYKGLTLEANLRYDLLVEDCVLIELKAVEEVHPVFEAQIMTYMRLLKKPKGILFNFFCANLFRKARRRLSTKFSGGCRRNDSNTQGCFLKHIGT